jgi:hypothetical protein
MIHVKYLSGLMSWQKSESKNPPSLHDMYVELNRLAGMYWIVCACKLIEGLEGVEIGNLNEKFNQQVNELVSNSSVAIFDELGGPLRLLSLAQLVKLCLEPGQQETFFQSHVVPQTKKFVDTYCSSSLPFWFDMRGVYCLVCLMSMSGSVENLSSQQRDFLIDYIYRSQAILGGFGSGPDAEAHGGYTFCSIASLKLMDAPVPRLNRLTRWLEARLMDMNGRVGKPRDSCYLWWIGASLVNIGRRDLFDLHRERMSEFITLNCACPETGGISKFPSVALEGEFAHGKQDADLLHTFLGIATLSLINNTIDPLHVLPS